VSFIDEINDIHSENDTIDDVNSSTQGKKELKEKANEIATKMCEVVKKELREQVKNKKVQYSLMKTGLFKKSRKPYYWCSYTFGVCVDLKKETLEYKKVSYVLPYQGQVSKNGIVCSDMDLIEYTLKTMVSKLKAEKVYLVEEIRTDWDSVEVKKTDSTLNDILDRIENEQMEQAEEQGKKSAGYTLRFAIFM